MPVPSAGLPPALQAFLQELEDRVAAIETPSGPTPGFTLTLADLTAANAAENAGRSCNVSDLKVSAWSDGVHWYRGDTGALIV